MTQDRNLKLYFPNLNGLRFIAACFVIINHVEQLKRYYHIGDGVMSEFSRIIGKLGVMLFFVLSGFLITYLLLSEESSLRKIHIRKFYIRRLLRIVPLYLLLIFLTFFVIYQFEFWEIPFMKNPLEGRFTTILILHLLFLPNLVTAIFGFIPYIAQAWSIGTEEQSYLLFPLLLRRFKKKRLLLMSGIIVFYMIIRLVLSERFFLNIPYRAVFSKFWIHFNIDVIAIGGIFAILLYKKHSILNKVVNLGFFYIVILVTVMLLLFSVRIPFIHYQAYAVLFGIIILNLATNERLKNVLEGRVISYLGQISYGIYMYHFIVLILVLKGVVKFGITSNWVIYPLILVGTILMSSISYHYFEAFFLKLKTKYTLVKSGGSSY